MEGRWEAVKRECRVAEDGEPSRTRKDSRGGDGSSEAEWHGEAVKR